MEVINNIGLLMGSSWASGVNLYLTIASLGIMKRTGAIELPGNLDILSNIFIISIAILLFLIEFVADKIPAVDSAWDAIHTFIRPLGSGMLGYMAMADMGPLAQLPVALITGAIAADSHLTKATTRVAINTSPEPVTNSIASLTEDGLVVGALYLIAKHPVIASIAVILFIIFSIWFLKKMFAFLKKALRFLSGKKEDVKGG
ncbi:MAG: DUF4126 domain-containing protein [Candidatus Omnitrophota bacterium]